MRHALSPLFDPRSLVVVSDRALPVTDSLPATLRDATTELRLVPGVSLDTPQTLSGVAAGERPDLALVSVAQEDTERALTAIGPLRPRATIVLSPLPSPTLSEWCRNWAREHDSTLLGPHSFGLQRPYAGLNASLHPQLARAGRVALVSQSRSLMASVMDWADDNRTAFSTVVSLGSEAALDVATVLDFLVSDSRTDSIALYLEDVRDARALMSVLRAAASVKPVVVLKAGRASERRSSVDPTGARPPIAPLAAGGVSADAVFDTALRRAGAVRVRFFVQLFSAVKALSFPKRPNGRRLVLFANGSGPAQLAFDLMTQGAAVTRALPTENTRILLREILGPIAWTDNPVVTFAPLTADQTTRAVEALIDDPEVDGVLTLIAPDPTTQMAEVARALARIAPRAKKPVLTCFMGDATTRALRRILDEVGTPSFRTPESALDAFASLAAYHYNQQLLQQLPPPESIDDAPDIEGARLLIDAAREDGRTTLTEPEGKALLAAFRIPVVQAILARTTSEAVIAAQQIGFPVAIKIASPDIERKSSVRGVHLDIRNTNELVTAFQRMLVTASAAAPNARMLGIAVQRMVGAPGAVKVSAGIVRDPLFGPVIRFGGGGSQAEVGVERGLELPPLNGFLAHRLIERARAWRQAEMPMVTPAALAQLEDLLLRVSEIACALPDILSLSIDPIMLTDDGVVAADCRVTVSAEQPAGDRGQDFAHMAIHPYPARLVSHAVFPDGQPYTIRPIRPEDAQPLQDFTRQLSAHTRYMRFISAMRELSPRMLTRYTQIDYDRELALVATVRRPDPAHPEQLREIIIGVARYLRNPDGQSAEYALVLGDDWQGRGLGMQLMRTIIAAARHQGLHRIEGFVLANNAPMHKLMKRLGFRNDPDPDDPAMRLVWLDLRPEVAAPAAEGALGASVQG
jgi:acetyltransferase